MSVTNFSLGGFQFHNIYSIRSYIPMNSTSVDIFVLIFLQRKIGLSYPKVQAPSCITSNAGVNRKVSVLSPLNRVDKICPWFQCQLYIPIKVSQVVP